MFYEFIIFFVFCWLIEGWEYSVELIVVILYVNVFCGVEWGGFEFFYRVEFGFDVRRLFFFDIFDECFECYFVLFVESFVEICCV